MLEVQLELLLKTIFTFDLLPFLTNSLKSVFVLNVFFFRTISMFRTILENQKYKRKERKKKERKLIPSLPQSDR